MSSPVLLIINGDTCSHCIKMMAIKDNINKAVKELGCGIRCIWICMDLMNNSLLPAELRTFVTHYPFVMYFPSGEWDKFLNYGDMKNIKVKDFRLFPNNNEDGITSWLRSMIDSKDRSVLSELFPEGKESSKMSCECPPMKCPGEP